MPDAPPSPSELPPPSPLGSAETQALVALLERIAREYTSGAASEAAAAARQQWLQRTGRVHDGDRGFDERMAQFMEWFLLDRPHGSARGTPAEAWLRRHGARLSSAERARGLGLVTSHRSAFTPCAAGEGLRWWIDDLLYGFRWPVTVAAPLPGLAPGDVFEGRVAAVGAEVHFTGAFCYHPPEVAARIRRHLERVARAGQSGPAVLDRLMRMRLDYDRAEGTPARRIYLLPAARS
jgi:hypothetical protein